MKIFFLSLLFCISINKINAQTITETDFIGKWKVKAIKEVNKPKTKAETARMDSIKKELKKAIFTFESNKKFSFNISIPELKVNDAFWQYLVNEEGIKISKKINASFDNSIFQIDVKVEKKKVYFYIEEIPFLFTVEKF
jgi:hypothetical protein